MSEVPEQAPVPEATPAPVAEAAPSTQDLPPGLAERVQAASTPAPEAAPAEPVVYTDLRSMIGAELAADPNARTAATLLERLCSDKVDVNRAFGKALEEDDMRFVDERYLKEILGDADAALALETAGQLMNYAEQRGEAIKQALVKDIPGGEVTLTAASTAFNAKADPATRAAIARLLDSGDMPSMQYAVAQIMKFATEAGQVVVHHEQPFGQPGAAQGLSKDAYIKAINVPNLPEAEYQRLRASRQLGINQGL